MDDAGTPHYDNHWEDWEEDHETYQQDHDQNPHWYVQDVPPQDYEVRVPYSRDDDHGSKRKPQHKPNAKTLKRPRVDSEPKR